MAGVFGDEAQFGGGNCEKVYVSMHICKALQAGFYGDAVECLTATRAIRVRFCLGQGRRYYPSPVTFQCQNCSFRG